MAAGEGTQQGDGAGAEDNVIRFPRDWFGSKEDLVPFGPSAARWDAAATAAATAAQAEADLASASDFWGEGAGALHQAMDIPFAEDAPMVVAPRVLSVGPDAVPEGVASAVGRRERRTRRPGGALRLAAVVLTAVLILAGAVVLTTGGGRPVPDVAAQSAARLSAVPQFPGPAAATVALAADQLVRARFLSTEALQARARSHARGHRRPSHRRPGHRHRVAKVQGEEPVASPQVVTPVSPPSDDTAPATATAGASASSGADATRTAAARDASAASHASTGSSDGSTSGVAKAAATGAKGSASERTTTSSQSISGPTGLGGVVGPNCDPKCSN